MKPIDMEKGIVWTIAIAKGLEEDDDREDVGIIAMLNMISVFSVVWEDQ